jgi:hypothetical protein
MSCRLSGLAEQDLDEIWFYVAEDASPTTADRLIDAIIDRPNSLGWVAFDPSSARAYDRSPLRITSSTSTRWGRPDRQSSARPSRSGRRVV